MPTGIAKEGVGETLPAVKPQTLDGFLVAVTNAVDRLSRTAGQGIVVFLLAVGAAIAAIAIGLRAAPTNIGTPEVVAACVLAFALVAFAGRLRYLEFRSALELMRHQIWKEEMFTRARLEELKSTMNSAIRRTANGSGA